MNTYIGLLRGINVGGHKKIKMADLREMLNKLNFSEVQTYIQSGNIVFKTSEVNKAELESTIKKEIAKTFGFEVPVLVKSREEIVSIVEENLYIKDENLEPSMLYFTLLHKMPSDDALQQFKEIHFDNEVFSMGNHVVYLAYKLGASKAKRDNNFIEKKLKVSATTRNLRTMQKLVELSS